MGLFTSFPLVLLCTYIPLINGIVNDILTYRLRLINPLPAWICRMQTDEGATIN